MYQSLEIWDEVYQNLRKGLRGSSLYCGRYLWVGIDEILSSHKTIWGVQGFINAFRQERGQNCYLFGR